jgi:pyruvate dehydrogenase E1 component beta subunit
MDPVYASESKTHRAVVVQEQWKPFGAAAEIAASITETMFDELDAPVARVTGEDVPMPYARNLELLATPHEPRAGDHPWSEEGDVRKWLR